MTGSIHVALARQNPEMVSSLFDPNVLIDIDRSGSITAQEMEDFLNEIGLITAKAEHKDRWLNFNHKLRNKGKEMKPRLYSKKNADRFKLSAMTKKFEFIFTDGEG